MYNEIDTITNKVKEEFLFYDIITTKGLSKIVAIKYDHNIKTATLTCVNNATFSLVVKPT